MRLHEIKKNYDVIISCGSSCAPAIHLRRLNLRKFSLPLDWVYSQSFADVGRLFFNRFNGYMDRKNMSLVNGSASFLDEDGVVNSGKTYFVKDHLYNVTSIHDFPILPEKDWTATYPSYKEKLNKRIERFNETISTSGSILFIRWSTNFEDALFFYSLMSKLIKAPFHILILNPLQTAVIVTLLDWNIPNTCALQVPNRINDDSIWNYVLADIGVND